MNSQGRCLTVLRISFKQGASRLKDSITTYQQNADKSIN